MAKKQITKDRCRGSNRHFVITMTEQYVVCPACAAMFQSSSSERYHNYLYIPQHNVVLPGDP